MQGIFVCWNRIQKLFLLTTAICIGSEINGQPKWDGEGGDGLWNTALNWTGNTIPASNDNVLLDNSIVTGSYSVTLPSGLSVTTVRTLTIGPVTGKVIEVVLPVSNSAVPAFIANGSVYGLEIHDGAIFRNSSGASAGSAVEVADSIKIFNGGLYIHNTSRAHANNVTVLSKAPGTERGSFEFDVPGGAGYTVSIAGRVYGNMILSAVAAGGTKSYTSTGMTGVHINGLFKINTGVNYSLNFNAPFVVHGDFVHHGNMFDISSGMHSNQISILQHMTQSGTLTESGTGQPVLEFGGTNNQNISVSGTTTESVTFRMNNPAGLTLLTPFEIAHGLILVTGNIRTTPINILVIKDNANCSGGSVNSFIEGPVRKIGDEDFEFQVGKQGDYAPVAIAGLGGNVTDEFEAEYVLGNPLLIFGSTVENPPIVRVSSLEYWKVERISGSSPKKLTFSIRTYSNATLLEKLVVTRWDIPLNIWKNEGNTSFSGIATGTITSGDIHSFGVFTIASTVIDQNPLPSSPLLLKAGSQDSEVLLRWQITQEIKPRFFEILRSMNNVDFVTIKKMDALPGRNHYIFSEKIPERGRYYYKIKITETDGTVRISNVTQVFLEPHFLALRLSSAVITDGGIHLMIDASMKTQVRLFVLTADGKMIYSASPLVYRGKNRLTINVRSLPAGIYYIAWIAQDKKTNTVRVVK